MLACPGCGGRLSRAATPGEPVLACHKCKGMAVAFGVLNKTADPAVLRRLWYGSTKTRPGESTRRCPHCDGAMHCVNLPAGTASIDLDVCSRCQIVWFDPTEYGRFTKMSGRDVAGTSTAPPAGAAVRKAQPAGESSLMSQASDAFGLNDDGGQATPQGWQWAPAMLGLPISLDAPPVTKRPLVTWGLSALLVALYAVWAMGGTLEANIKYWGFIPAEWARHGGMTILTCFFLHAGLLHVLSNVYFFLIFGDNVEDAIGRLKFVILIFLAHIAGIGLHALVGTEPSVPCVGASAGISGVLAFYAVSYPQARVGLFLRFIWLRIRVWTALVLYIALQLLGMLAASYGHGDQVAYSAHVGGLAVGLLAGFAARFMKEQKF